MQQQQSIKSSYKVNKEIKKLTAKAKKSRANLANFINLTEFFIEKAITFIKQKL